MAKYVDGFVIPLKKIHIKKYKKMAELGRKVWMKHGALDYYECVGDELNNPWGLNFKKLCKLKANETVIFAFVIYKSKADRKRVNAKVHKDPSMQQSPEWEGIMDHKRFTVGGFNVLVTNK